MHIMKIVDVVLMRYFVTIIIVHGGVRRVYCSSFRTYPYPPPPHRRNWNFLGGGGFCKAKKCKEMYEAYLEFPVGLGGLRKNSLHGGGMYIFWKYTFAIVLAGLLCCSMVFGELRTIQ